MGDTEFDLIEAIAKGDQQAFEALVKRYKDPLLNFIYRYVGDRSTAEDLTQEVFLRVYKASHRFEPRARVSTWIFRIAYNLSINEIQRLRRLRKVAGDVRAETCDRVEPATDSVYRMELEEEVMASLGCLTENQRAALLLRVNEGLSYKEISEVLEVSLESVESLIFRARRRLRNHLGRGRKE